MYYYIKVYGFSADFPIFPVGAAICRPPERASVPHNISAQRAEYNRGNAVVITPRRGGNLPPAKTATPFSLKFPRLRGIQSRHRRATTFLIAIIFGLQIDLIAAAGCTSFRKEGDRREAVVEDSSTAQAIYNLCRRHPNFKRLMLILTLLHTVAPLVRERLWRSRTLHRSQANGPPLFEERYSLRLNFSVFCVIRL